MSFARLPDKPLAQDDLVQALSFAHRCLECPDVAEFHAQILDFAAFLGFEFVLYGYTQACYNERRKVHVINLSNPQEWAEEYERDNCLQHDPVVHEMERRFAAGDHAGFIYWDAYEWPLSPEQSHVIERRRHWGLEYGCSVFADSHQKDFAFLVSFASQHTEPDERVAAMMTRIVPQLLMTRKRLSMLELVAALTVTEVQVATEMMSGKTNWQIAHIFDVSENTVKFHIKNIFDKLCVNNRQQAIGVLLAERYLSL